MIISKVQIKHKRRMLKHP